MTHHRSSLQCLDEFWFDDVGLSVAGAAGEILTQSTCFYDRTGKEGGEIKGVVVMREGDEK